MNEYAIEARVTNEGPKTGIAFAIWWFLGLLGGHRYYLGRKGSGTAMLLLSLSVFGLIISLPWWLIDGFLVSGMCREDREEMRNKLRVETMYHRHGANSDTLNTAQIRAHSHSASTGMAAEPLE